MTQHYHLHVKQGLILQDTSRFKVLVAGRRFGKTILAVMSLLLKALENPEQVFWYVAPTYRQAKMIAWRLLKNILPEGEPVKINEQELSVEFIKRGSRIELKGADNEDSLRGMGINGLVVDEFATIFNNWAVWNEVLRPMLTDTKGWALFIGTPKGKDALWELFMKGQRKEDDFNSWRFKTVDNPFIEKEEVEKARQELPQRYFRQEYEASFEDYTGLIWPEFNKEHIIKPIYLDKSFPRVGAIDPAISGTTGILKAAIDEDGNITIYDEYYEPNKRVSEVCEAVKDNLQWFIDPASAAKNIMKDGKLYNLYDEYTDNGINARPAEHSVEGGINRVAEYFKTDKIRIFSTCVKLIWELERYHYVEPRETVKGEMKAEPYKSNDHLCDCLRYLIMSRSQKAEIDRSAKIEKGSVAYYQAQDEIEAQDWKQKYL